MTPIIPGIIASSDGHQPGTPTIGTATAGNAAATAAFTVPTYLGKPTGTSYRAFTQPVTVRSTTGTIGTVTLTGSTYSAPITGMSAVTNLFVNQVITATAGTGTLGAGTVTIAAILSSTSIQVASTATMTAGTITNILGGIFGTNTVSPITVTGLTNGTAYTFRVNLDNTIATSLSTAASNSITPIVPPPYFVPPPPYFVPPYFVPPYFVPPYFVPASPYFKGFTPPPPYVPPYFVPPYFVPPPPTFGTPPYFKTMPRTEQ